MTCHCGNKGMELTSNKSQHTKFTLEKKILPPLLPGFELATFRSRVRRSNQQAIPTGVVGECSPSESTLSADSLFCVRSTAVLPQWHIKDPGHSAKSAGGRLHLNTNTPLTQRSRSGLTMPLSGQSVGTYPETSSHATCQGTIGHSRLNSLSHCGLILV